MIKGFFFDLDGTLVDTHQANFEAYKRALEEIGTSITFDDFKATIGLSAKQFLPILGPNLSEAQHSQVVSRKAVHYKDLAHLSRLNEPLYDFIRTMSLHYTVGLVTTAKQKNAEVILEHHKLAQYFDFVITAADVEEPKPAPEPYLLALQKSGLKPEEVIAFEDSETGRQSAESAGIRVIMVKDFVV